MHRKGEFTLVMIMRHIQSKKKSSAPPSGMPGVETMVPLMLQEVVEKRLDLSRLGTVWQKLLHRLGLSRGRIEKGQPADFMFVNLNKSEKIDADNLHSRANWSPFEDWEAIFPHKDSDEDNLFLRIQKFPSGEASTFRLVASGQTLIMSKFELPHARSNLYTIFGVFFDFTDFNPSDAEE